MKNIFRAFLLLQIVPNNSKFQDLLIRKEGKYYIRVRRKDILLRIRLRLTTHGFILHKVPYKKGRKHDYDIYKNNHPVIPKEVVNVVDLGYFGIETDFQNNYPPYHIKRKETNFYQMMKNIIIKFILKRE